MNPSYFRKKLVDLSALIMFLVPRLNQTAQFWASVLLKAISTRVKVAQRLMFFIQLLLSGPLIVQIQMDINKLSQSGITGLELSMGCKGNLQYFEQLHFGDFLITVHIPSLQEQPDLIFSGVPALLRSHGVVEVGRYLGVLHIPIVVLIVFLEYNVDRLADLLVTAQHYLILQMEQDTFIVAIGQQQLSVSRKVADVSMHFHNILTLGIDEEQIQIDPAIVDKETFDHFLRFCAINDYHEPVVCKVTTNNLQEVLDSKNYDFIKEFPIDSEKLMKLLGAANFLVCRGLKLVIAAVYACKIYFEDTKQAYLNKKKELNISEKDEITFEDDQKYRQDYMIEESIINDTV